jgi:protein-tyrosine phosphatase
VRVLAETEGEPAVACRSLGSKCLRGFRAAGIAVVAVLILGNGGIFAATLVARAAGSNSSFDLPGIKNLEVVDDGLWRGAAPSARGYEALAAQGVKTVIDLRAEEGLPDERPALGRLGVDLVRIPIRDGQAPTPTQVSSFLDTVAASSGRVFVNCGAGVGRTGTMAAAYLFDTGSASPAEAMVRNLAVGPPSLEQLFFVGGLGDGDFSAPPAPVTALSRFLDAPRRLLVRF